MAPAGAAVRTCRAAPPAPALWTRRSAASPLSAPNGVTGRWSISQVKEVGLRKNMGHDAKGLAIVFIWIRLRGWTSGQVMLNDGMYHPVAPKKSGKRSIEWECSEMMALQSGHQFRPFLPNPTRETTQKPHAMVGSISPTRDNGKSCRLRTKKPTPTFGVQK